jgi:hypothetical protein
VLLSAGCSDAPGYWFAGTVRDGTTGAIIKDFSVAVAAGNDSLDARADEQQAYSLGPVAPGTDYALTVTANGYRELRFAGPALVTPPNKDADVGIVRDAYLYPSGGRTPATVIRLVTAGGNATFDAVATFEPIPGGTPPGAISVDAPGPASVTAFRQPAALSWPNDSDLLSPSFSRPLEGGVLMLEEGALALGVTYRLGLTGIPGQTDLEVSFTAVGGEVAVTLGSSDGSAPSVPGSSADYREFFTGRVYDGVTGQRIQDYRIRLEYLDQIVAGSVDSNGRYLIGPLTQFNDYTVAIEADGYRSFLSHNAMLVVSAAEAKRGVVSRYYDAYLFPLNAVVEPVEFRILAQDRDQPLAGTLRLKPTGGSLLLDGAANKPAGVGAQIWDNDEDIQGRAVSVTVADGSAQVTRGALVYGVNYAVEVFGVPGYRLQNATHRAGLEGNSTLVLTPIPSQAIAIVFDSSQQFPVVADGSLTLIFNQPVVFDPIRTQTAYVEDIDAGFNITSRDADADGMTNSIRPSGRGIQVELDQNRLTFRWDPSRALQTRDADDPINSVSWGNLDRVRLAPVGAVVGSNRSRSLSEMLNFQRTVTVVTSR